MNKESPEYERVREDALLTDEEIGKVCNCEIVADHDWFDVLLPWCKRATQVQLDKVLKTEGVCINTDDQTTPYSEYVDGIFCGKKKIAKQSIEKNTIYEKAQLDMLKAGFVKVVSNAK